jgi:hypothetical protein
MSQAGIPSDHGIALAWLQCGNPGVTRSCVAARVTVLQPMNSGSAARYFRRALNPGRATDMGSSSGTRFISLSASSYST